MQFQEWLKAKLDTEKISFSELARRGNISQATISFVMAGKRPVTPKVCLAVATAFGLPIADVLAIAGIKQKDSSTVYTELFDVLEAAKGLSPEDRQHAVTLIKMLKEGKIKLGGKK
jgi:transcriptional regulator with XRE-family HTH domain